MRLKTILPALALAGAAALALAQPAAASIVTVDFSGVLNRPFIGPLTGAFSGTATYDTAAADTSQPNQFGAVTDFTMTSPVLSALYGQSTVSDGDFTGSTGDVQMLPDDAAAGFDQYQLTLHFGGPHLLQFNLDLLWPTGSIPGGYGLPTTLPSLASTTFAGSRLDDFFGDVTLGTITNFTLTSADDSPPPGPGSVPEPASWALMISGFGLAGAALRRRRTVVPA